MVASDGEIIRISQVRVTSGHRRSVSLAQFSEEVISTFPCYCMAGLRSSSLRCVPVGFDHLLSCRIQVYLESKMECGEGKLSLKDTCLMSGTFTR